MLAVLIRRVVRREYVFSVWSYGRVDLHVDAASVPYFVLDLVWLAFGCWRLTGPAWLDPAFDLGTPVIILVTVAVLAGLRIRARAVGATRR